MHPFLSPELHVRWSELTADRVEPDIRHALKNAAQAIETICAQDSEQSTYESTFLALENATEELSRGWGRLHHLDSVEDQPERRKALNLMLPDVTEFYSSIPLNERLWKVLKAFGESRAVAKLDAIGKRFVAETMEDFRQSGADLPPDKKQRVAEIESELSKLTKQYGERVLDSTNAWELVIEDEAKLAGLPESAKAAAAANARAKGHGTEDKPAWRFTLQFPSMFPIMQYLEDDAIRRQVWEASGKVGGYGEYDNSSLVWKILELRHEKAEMLGQDHFADLTLLRRMAKTGAGALEFVENMHQRVKPAFLAECRQLAQYKAAKTGQPEDLLEPWEAAYWAERQRK
ncbi:MAG TPA: M3 family metallopeptidase, partial [Luteolibacter sp.]|nr:M3 family metallopeptidase [Luteolibacter sp.]